MPFELGLVVAWDKLHPGEHVWFVFESKKRRLLKSLSDLAGTDAYVHGGRPRGLFRELSNALVRAERRPTVGEMASVYRALHTVYLQLVEVLTTRNRNAPPIAGTGASRTPQPLEADARIEDHPFFHPPLLFPIGHTSPVLAGGVRRALPGSYGRKKI